MAAPTPTARGTIPSPRKRLKDGFKLLVTFARYPTIALWEISGKPPGMDGGGGIDINTMQDDAFRPKYPRAKITETDATLKCAYDPATEDDIENMINIPDTITYRWFDGSTKAFFGFLDKWEPDELVEGTMPTGVATIIASSWDHANEITAGPVVTSVAGS